MPGPYAANHGLCKSGLTRQTRAGLVRDLLLLSSIKLQLNRIPVTRFITLTRYEARPPMSRIPKPISEETANDDNPLELPIDPDEGASLIPDEEERVVNVPS